MLSMVMGDEKRFMEMCWCLLFGYDDGVGGGCVSVMQKRGMSMGGLGAVIVLFIVIVANCPHL